MQSFWGWFFVGTGTAAGESHLVVPNTVEVFSLSCPISHIIGLERVRYLVR
jgi:hypothetical protein